ncbi:MAG: PAS-domain containing protein [Caulobacteraceae bacterium]
MSPHDILLAVSMGFAGAAVGGTLAVAIGRRVAAARLSAADRRANAANAAAEAFDNALILIDDGRPGLVGGSEALAACAHALGGIDAEPGAVIAALAARGPDHALQLDALFARGEACAFEVSGPHGGVSVEGRSAGALAWLRLGLLASEPAGLPTAARLAAFIDAREDPAWIAGPDGTPAWANRAWLEAVASPSLDEALDKGASLDREADALARAAASQGARQEALRWVSLPRGRRALRIRAQPLEGGGAAVWTQDVTAMDSAGETLARHTVAHDLLLGQIGDAVAVFGPDLRLAFHNPAFAALWELEPAWLADGPSHGEVLDRLRQRRRLPETIDYAKFKAEELARHADPAPSPQAIWRLPGERTLRVLSQPHPAGGLTMLYSDITPELRLKTQFNHLIQVQRATLDKLTDAVAVFGSDARLTLHNEAFERFWGLSPEMLGQSPDFDGVADLCVPRLHDRQFWRDLKGRVTDPDPRARAPMVGEVTTAERRIVAFQSRPLPDGATLVSFADVTDTRRLEGALSDREAALDAAERLKREFVGAVSHELRTPLTTIVGYSELLERGGEGLGEPARGYVAAVRTAARHLARSIDNVLTMADIDAGELVLEIGDLDVDALLAAAAERWAGEARAAEVEIAITGGGETGLIRGDALRLAQVLDHLMENALRHTPAGGAVTVSAVRALGEARLQVADNGRGILFHVQAHIFDRFSGADGGASGLGLALVKALVELHGGWVALESEPGAGAAFTCHLPEAGQTPEARPELF